MNPEKRNGTNAKAQRCRDARIARSVWSAWSLPPLLKHPRPTTAPASWTHSKRFAWQFIHKNLRSLHLCFRAYSFVTLGPWGTADRPPKPARGESLVTPTNYARWLSVTTG